MTVSKWYTCTTWIFAALLLWSPTLAQAQVSTVSSTISANPLVAGQVQKMSLTLTSTSYVSGLIVDLRIYGPDGKMIFRKGHDPVTITAGGRVTLTGDYQLPKNLPLGTYGVQIGVWNSSWVPYLYEYRQTFSVVAASSAPAPAPTPAPAPAASGVYNIRPNLNTGFCADLDKAATVPGARVYIYQCISGNANQAFSFASTGEVKLHRLLLGCIHSCGGS